MHAIVPTEKESLFPFHFGDEWGQQISVAWPNF